MRFFPLCMHFLHIQHEICTEFGIVEWTMKQRNMYEIYRNTHTSSLKFTLTSKSKSSIHRTILCVIDSIKYSQLKWYGIIYLLLLMFNAIFHVHHFDKIQYKKCACQKRPQILINNIDIVSHHAAFFLVELIWWNKIQRR